MMSPSSLLNFFTLLLILFSSPLVASQKKYKLSIAAIFRDEAPYLKEWIEFHRLVGVDHFYLYNNESNDNYDEVLAPYIEKKIVTLTQWPDIPYTNPEAPYAFVLDIQVPAIVHACYAYGKAESDWIAMIDLDEFLVPVHSSSLLELLDQYQAFVALEIYWHVYGTSNVPYLPENTLLIEALQKVAKANHGLNKSVYKTIVKPEYFTGFFWPPHQCKLKNGGRAIRLSKKEVRLHHYINRTEDYFFNCKVKKKEKAQNFKLTDEAVKEWSEVGNDDYDHNNPILRFVPELRKRMGFTD